MKDIKSEVQRSGAMCGGKSHTRAHHEASKAPLPLCNVSKECIPALGMSCAPGRGVGGVTLKPKPLATALF